MARLPVRTLILIAIVAAGILGICLVGPAGALPPTSGTSDETSVGTAIQHQAPDDAVGATDVVTITVLHTNDFHGNLELSGSNPGIARVAAVINSVRTSVGSQNVLLLDAGDIMQGTLLSNLFSGESTIDLYNTIGYEAATLGNHEFDWSQSTLISRTEQANFPFVTANVVTGACDGWTSPSYVRPWITKTVGTPGNQVTVGIVGVTSQETPYITLAANTAGLCFKDAAESVTHYYDEIKAAGAQTIIVLSHLGNTDGGYGYGIPVYGDQTLARRLVEAGKPVSLIIGGHSHTDLAAAQVVSGTTVVQAHYAGRKVGRADLAINRTTGATVVTWQRLTVSAAGTQDPTAAARVAVWASDPWYQGQINRVAGYTAVTITRDYNGDSLMGSFIDDAIYYDLNGDGTPANDVDMVLSNPGNLRSDITTGGVSPYTLTHGMLYSVLPFGNQTIVGDMTGAQILDLFNQSATLFKGALQVSGVRYGFYRYSDALPGPQPWAWGAYSVTVRSRSNPAVWEPLVLTRTYRVATNEFLAPAGQDGFAPFKYMTNISYWGDQLDGVERWVTRAYTVGTPYNGALDGRIQRDGTDASGPIVPVTILHNNDSHGRLNKTAYVGFTQLATIINQERQHNPSRTVLLNAGDQIQGDNLSFYFRTAPTGYLADGTPTGLTTNPVMAAMNAMTYTAMTPGHADFAFGANVFTTTFKQASFPLLMANVRDDGRYGLSQVPILPHSLTTLPGPHGDIRLALLGLGYPNMSGYQMANSIAGLTFTDPITEAQTRLPSLRAANDVVVALTHLGFTDDGTTTTDDKYDTDLAAQTAGLDAIIGGHSHTNPATASGEYKYLPAIVSSAEGKPVIVNQAYRYNSYLGEVVLGLRAKDTGGYEVLSRVGRDIQVSTSTLEDSRIKSIVDPYVTALNAYLARSVGQTTVPLDGLSAYTQETNAANLQADAAMWKLAQLGITVDFHLSGAMANSKIAASATQTTPVMLTVNDLFTHMPYENSLVVMRVNGPQLKALLERSYRNYYYYKYVPGRGGYSYYTSAMLDISHLGAIRFMDTYPTLPSGHNVLSLMLGTSKVDFNDPNTYYTVSTCDYLALGGGNFNDGGVTIWPVGQDGRDTKIYARDAVIDYIAHLGTISPVVEGRLTFEAAKNVFVPVTMRNSQ